MYRFRIENSRSITERGFLETHRHLLEVYSGCILWNGSKAHKIETKTREQQIEYLEENRYIDVYATENGARTMNTAQRLIMLEKFKA